MSHTSTLRSQSAQQRIRTSTCCYDGSHQAIRLWRKSGSQRGLITTHASRSIEQQLDDILLTAVNLHHDKHGEYMQAVMVSSNANGPLAGQPYSPAMSLWPKGMVVYLVGTAGDQLRAPDHQANCKGVLMRNILVEEMSGGALEGALTRAGFQAQRLSVWLLQVQNTGEEQELENMIADMSECAAQGSLLLGQASGWQSADVREALASSGFLGSVTDVGDGAKGDELRCMFTTQQHQFSLAQTGMYNRHVAAANDTDEDFLGNFS